MRDDLSSIVSNVAEHLRFLSECGVEELPVPLAPDRPAGGESLEEIRADLGECTRCPLHAGRTQIVFGVGNPKARLMFVGEAPGEEEDRKGEPFVGRAGQLLTDMIRAMGFSRSDVYIANIIKSRPPQNRAPLPNEIAACSPFLFRQIQAIRPTVIVALGAVAAQTLLSTTEKISRLRGKFQTIGSGPPTGIPVMPTYHPSYLLRNQADKKNAWADLKQVMERLK